MLTQNPFERWASLVPLDHTDWVNSYQGAPAPDGCDFLHHILVSFRIGKTFRRRAYPLREVKKISSKTT